MKKMRKAASPLQLGRGLSLESSSEDWRGGPWKQLGPSTRLVECFLKASLLLPSLATVPCCVLFSVSGLLCFFRDSCLLMSMAPVSDVFDSLRSFSFLSVYLFGFDSYPQLLNLYSLSP